MVLAARGSTWGGMVVGLVALGIFVIFSAWIVVLRTQESKAQRVRKKDKPDD